MGRLDVWVIVEWDSGGNKKHSNGRLNYDHEHTKPATRLDHGHKLNKANLKQNCKSQKGSRTAENFFVGFFVDSRYMKANESKGKTKGNTLRET